MFCRTFVAVTAVFGEGGSISPLSLRLHGKEYGIDRVLTQCHAAALKAGGEGIRYTVRIRGRETFLFLDGQHRWFVEEKCNVRPISGD